VRQGDIDTGTIGNRAQRDAVKAVGAEFGFRSIQDGGAAIRLRGGQFLLGVQERFLSLSTLRNMDRGPCLVKAAPLQHARRPLAL
jgi:hypothetical protein